MARSPLPPKWCPECRDEFVHSMQRCPTCGVDLVMEQPAERPESSLLGDWAQDLAKAQPAPPPEWSEAEACPACNAALSPEDERCAECGLEFVESEAP